MGLLSDLCFSIASSYAYPATQLLSMPSATLSYRGGRTLLILTFGRKAKDEVVQVFHFFFRKRIVYYLFKIIINIRFINKVIPFAGHPFLFVLNSETCPPNVFVTFQVFCCFIKYSSLM